MTRDELFQLGKDPPIRLADGRFGLVTHYIRAEEAAGVKIPGQDQLYEIPLARIMQAGDGALLEAPPPR